MHIDGGCQCGQVTYKAEIDPATSPSATARTVKG
jgi:hypothetical protein